MTDQELLKERADHPSEPIRVGISSCLLGEEVRFDGGHKRDSYINGTLARYFEFVPFCPEMAIGLGKPREPIRLVGEPDRPRAIGVRTKTLDVTERLEEYGHRIGADAADLSGYILKRASPSCGMERVKVYLENGHAGGQGTGVFARAMMSEQPLLPVEEEGRLGDPMLRENFIGRVFAYHRWQVLVREGLSRPGLIAFHTQHKLLLLAHDQQTYRDLGRLVARVGIEDISSVADRYITEFMRALSRRVSRAQHLNVLQHLAGYLKRHIDAEDRAELVETFAAYRRGELPLVVPITLLKHHFRRHPDPYVLGQHYLEPHPKELMLRNLL